MDTDVRIPAIRSELHRFLKILSELLASLPIARTGWGRFLGSPKIKSKTMEVAMIQGTSVES